MLQAEGLRTPLLGAEHRLNVNNSHQSQSGSSPLSIRPRPALKGGTPEGPPMMKSEQLIRNSSGGGGGIYLTDLVPARKTSLERSKIAMWLNSDM